VIIIIDASTLINLVNGEILSRVLYLPKTRFLVSGMVVEESKTIASVIKEATAAGFLNLVDADLISMSAFTKAKTELNLGDGETECILAAAIIPCHFACDDRAARKCAKKRLALTAVMGSIGLLQMAVKSAVLTPEEAMSSYKKMVAHGGYLPELAFDHFDEFIGLDSLRSQP
jgi:predicted nucleic acid-binding protein